LDHKYSLMLFAGGFCLVKIKAECNDIRWTNSDRLLVEQTKKCLGVPSKSAGSGIKLYDCDENSELQKWECRNETILALKDQDLYVELTADNTAVLSETIGANNHLTIRGTDSGACTRTYRELYTIGGNAAGRPCMFPFLYKDQWYSDCTSHDSIEKRLWCAIETKFQGEHWGYCPVTSKHSWNRHPTTGSYYQLNTESTLTWPQAEVSCRQQGASLLSITDPHQQAYVTALLGTSGSKLWSGLILDPEHSWKWSNGRPYSYMRWDSGYPLGNPGHNCVIVDPAANYFWQNTPCSKKLGYICYIQLQSISCVVIVTAAAEAGFCLTPWIPFNTHCFRLIRTLNTWSDAQRQCRKIGGDLASVHSIEDQSFLISQSGYASTDEIWIGLNDGKSEGLFEWADHSTVSFTSWEYGKPDVSSEIKDCVLIRGENGNWVDRMCNEKHEFICMKMSTSTPSGEEVSKDIGCKYGWRRQNSYCYFIVTKTKSFPEAEADCKSYNSYLADVSKGVDNAFLVSLVGMRPEKHFWIGLTNQKNINRFVWTNKDKVTFTNWNVVMPGIGGCVAITTGVFAGLWDVLPCTNTLGYICKQLAEGAGLTTVPPTFTPDYCAKNWTPLRSSEYLSVPERRTWFEAREFCRAIGGDLVSIHSYVQLQQVRTAFTSMWIGLSAPDPTTGFVWSDGSPLQYQHWLTGQPDNRNNVQSCVEIMMKWHHYTDGSWNDVRCEKTNGWTCQIAKGVTPNPLPTRVPPAYSQTLNGWLKWNGNEYSIVLDRMSIEQARQHCKKKNSDLVSITRFLLSLFLLVCNQISTHERLFWIGLTVDLDKTAIWMDGSPVVFQMWEKNQPHFLNNDEHCVAMSSVTECWHNLNCGFENYAICKRSSGKTYIAAAPTVSPIGGCPANWTKLASGCYKFVNKENATWDGARTHCKAMGGNLASIDSKSTQAFLTVAMAEAPTTDLWIGLISINKQPYYWTNGQAVKYTNFQPDRECFVMSTNVKSGIGTWAKKSCNERCGYICLRNVDPLIPDNVKPIIYTDYVPVINDTFRVNTQEMSWNAAKRFCESEGAKLASLRNEWAKSYSHMMSLNLNTPLWIGLNRKATGGYFRFIDGFDLTTIAWDHFQPRAGYHCVYVNQEGKWQTGDCDRKMASLCIKSTDVPPTRSTYRGVCPQYQSPRMHSSEHYSWIPFKDYCYLFVIRTVDWSDASVSCARLGATLASIEDPSEQEFIKRNIFIYSNSYSSFWIGLYRTLSGMWQWVDKTPVDYTNWGTDSSFTSGAINSEDGQWTSDSEHSSKPYVCKVPKSEFRGYQLQVQGVICSILEAVLLAQTLYNLSYLYLNRSN
uniref:Mannose receptor, C type 1b n=1 Tax=Takifugu rubripes TaxID=31033 RepID=A0A674PBS8_TAKRU